MIAILMAGQLALATPLESGLYHLQTEVLIRSRVPIFGENIVTTTTQALARVDQRDGLQTVRQLTCDVDIQDGSRAITTVPPSFIKALPTIEYTLTADTEGIRLTGGDQRVGVLADQAGVPDSKVGLVAFDTDKDGRPGATIHLRVPIFGTIDIYVAQRTRTSLTGTLTSSGAQGTVQVESIDQSTLGASHPLFRASPSFSPVEGGSSFSLVRIPEGTECHQLPVGDS